MTSATAPAMRLHLPVLRRLPSVVIEVLGICAPGLERAVDVDELVDPRLEPCPAEAWPGVQFEREQFRGAADVEPCGVGRNHRDEDVVIARDLRKAVALVQQP